MDDRFEPVGRALRFIEERRLEQPKLGAVADHVGLSRCYLSRLFRRGAGVSPDRFLSVLTAAHAEAMLRDGASVLQTALETGLSGPARLHDLVTAVHAVTPGELKRGGGAVAVRWGFADSPFGECLIAATPRGVCALTFVTDGRDAAIADLKRRWPDAAHTTDHARAAKLAERIFGGSLRRGRRGVELLVRGTNFQIQVWQALLRIPEGCAVSYGDLARALGRQPAARAVGNAVGANPVAWLIPCHRVLRSSRALGGYRWGLSVKRAMLERESRPELR